MGAVNAAHSPRACVAWSRLLLVKKPLCMVMTMMIMEMRMVP